MRLPDLIAPCACSSPAVTACRTAASTAGWRFFTGTQPQIVLQARRIAVCTPLRWILALYSRSLLDLIPLGLRRTDTSLEAGPSRSDGAADHLFRRVHHEKRFGRASGFLRRRGTSERGRLARRNGCGACWDVETAEQEQGISLDHLCARRYVQDLLYRQDCERSIDASARSRAAGIVDMSGTA